jgi:hypothetical protein
VKASAKLNCALALVNAAAEMTTHGQAVNAPLEAWFRSEHSPARMVSFWVELEGVETFVSVHFSRHKVGVDHFVQSNRDDRGGNGTEGRNTPVNHGMVVNAQALINMARRRLCYKSHKRTVSAMQKIKLAVGRELPELEKYLVPECVYRNGICPEFSECKPGLKNVMAAYAYYPELFARGKRK